MTAHSPGVTTNSLSALLETQRSTRGAAIAVQHKKHGLWHTMDYTDLAARVAEFAGGLTALGVTAADSVAIVGEVSPEWIVADLAVAHLGARSVAIAPQTPGRTLLALLGQFAPKVVVAGDQEQVDLLMASDLGAALVVIDPRGTGNLGERVQTFAQVCELSLGNKSGAAASSIVTMFSEDGPDGPLGFDHNGSDLADLAVAAAAWLGLTPSDRNLVVLSPAIATARLLDIYAALAAGSRIAIPESPATVQTDLVEYQPTVLTLSPRAVQLLRLSSLRRARESSRGRRAVIRWALRQADTRVRRTSPTSESIGSKAVDHLLVGAAVRTKSGLRRTRRIAVVDAPISATDLNFLWSLRIPALMTFGGAAFGGAAMATRGTSDAFSPGQPLPGNESRVTPDGVLELRTAVTAGEWRTTDETVAVDAAGSLRQGRRSDWLELPNGQVSPLPLERALLESPYVDRALVTVGHAGGLVAVIEPEPWASAEWAVEHGVHFSTHHSLVTAAEVVEMIGSQARQQMSALIAELGLPEAEEVIVLSEPLTVGAGELTTLLGIRRRAVLELVQGRPQGSIVGREGSLV